METLFSALTNALGASTGWAVSAALVWGILSILLSPCHLSSIPLIVGFMSGRERISTLRAFALSTWFACGILLTIAILGVATAIAGRMLGDVGAAGNYLVSLVFFAVGLHLLGVISIPWFSAGGTAKPRKGLWAAFILGLIFGVAVGPCTFAYMAPMLGVAFKTGADRPVYASILLLTFGAGHCSIIVLAGTSMGWVERYLKWDAKSKGTQMFRNVTGIAVILAGLYLVYTAK